jgi:uncharacterized linocin/CFP29 family protein
MATTQTMNALMGAGRERLWNPEIWKSIDDAVNEEVGMVRIAQKLFPTELMPGATTVDDHLINIGQKVPLQVQEGAVKKFVELFAEFVLTPNQAAMEGTTGVARKLARLAAKALAQAEDRVLFQGSRAAGTLAELSVQVRSAPDAFPKGLLFESDAGPVRVDTSSPPKDPNNQYPESILGGVSDGISRLHASVQNEPFGLILETSVYGDSSKTIGLSSVMPKDRFVDRVKRGFYQSEALFFNGLEPAAARGSKPVEQRDGLLAAFSGQPTTIYMGQDAMTLPTQTDVLGNLHFIVVERIQYVCHDPRSLLRIEFRPQKSA